MANRMVKTQFDTNTRLVTWTFPGSDAEALVLHLSNISEENLAHAVFHGLNQKVSDAAADEKTAAAKRAAMAAIVAHLESGTKDWNRKAIHTPKVLDVGLVVTAICNVKTAGDVDKANRYIDAIATKRNIGRTEAAQVWADTPEIGAEMARIERSRKPATVDAAALEAEMEAAAA